jgi:hypothetical protein
MRQAITSADGTNKQQSNSIVQGHCRTNVIQGLSYNTKNAAERNGRAHKLFFLTLKHSDRNIYRASKNGSVKCG